MSSVRLVFSSSAQPERRRDAHASPGAGLVRPLSRLAEGSKGVIVEVAGHGGRADRLLALGVTPGASVTLLQRFPGIVFLCDQTELAVERAVADTVLVRLLETPS
jgi:Fe2+ transport system protein FeoA